MSVIDNCVTLPCELNCIQFIFVISQRACLEACKTLWTITSYFSNSKKDRQSKRLGKNSIF